MDSLQDYSDMSDADVEAEASNDASAPQSTSEQPIDCPEEVQGEAANGDRCSAEVDEDTNNSSMQLGPKRSLSPDATARESVGDTAAGAAAKAESSASTVHVKLTYRQQLALAMQQSKSKPAEADSVADSPTRCVEDAALGETSGQNAELVAQTSAVVPPGTGHLQLPRLASNSCCFCGGGAPLPRFPTEHSVFDSLVSIGDETSPEELVSHEECLLYASGLQWERRPGMSVPYDPVKKEIRRARQLKCAACVCVRARAPFLCSASPRCHRRAVHASRCVICKRTGASVGCAKAQCKRCYHLPCWLEEWEKVRPPRRLV
jgi:hypothetical protein